MDDDFGAVDELPDAVRVADVATQLFDRTLELGVVEGHDVEGAHLVAVGQQPSSQMQAEEARAAGDRPPH